MTARLCWKPILALASVIALFTSNYAFAQANCADVLVPEIKSLSIDRAESYAYIDTIEKNVSSASRASSGASLIVDDIRLSMSGKRARKFAERFKRETGINWTAAESLRLTEVTLSEQAVRAYQLCQQGKKRDGIRLFVFDATTDKITAAISWTSGFKAPTKSKSCIRIFGAKNYGFGNKCDITKWWENQQKYTFIFERIPDKEFRIAVNLGGDSASKTVPAIPKIVVDRKQVKLTFPSKGTHRMANDGTGRNQGPISGCLDAPDNGLFIPTNASVDITLKVGALDNTTYAKITKRNYDQVCWQAFLRPLSREGGGDFRFRVVAPMRLYTFKRSSK